METRIDNINLLLPKKVPKHGKVSGIKSENGAVRVIIPNENTKLTLIVSNPSEILARNVTPDGKILGLTNFIGKTIIVIDQEPEDFEKETNLVSFFDEGEDFDDELMERLYRVCEEKNLDPADFFAEAIKNYMKKEDKDE